MIARCFQRLLRLGPGFVVICGLTACIAPSVVASEGRAVHVDEDELVWSAARAEDLDGLFESVRIEGEAAAALGKVYYQFSPDGTYSGAALVFAGGRAVFRTLSGHWTLSGGALDLGDGQAAQASAAPDHLRLETPGGVAWLRRVPLE